MQNSDNILEGVAEFISQRLGNELKAPEYMQKAVYAVTTYAVLEIASEVFSIGSGFTKVNFHSNYLIRI